MTKQQYKKVRALLLKLRKGPDRYPNDHDLYNLTIYRANYLRFKKIKTSKAKESYIQWRAKALAGPVGKLP